LFQTKTKNTEDKAMNNKQILKKKNCNVWQFLSLLGWEKEENLHFNDFWCILLLQRKFVVICTLFFGG